MMSQFFDMLSSSIFSDVDVFLLCFVMTGSGVMTIFVYKWSARNLEMGNTPVWVLLNVWRLGQGKVSEYPFKQNKNVLKKWQCYYIENFRWCTHLYMSLFLPVHPPSVHPSVCRAAYLRNRTSSDHKFWYTYGDMSMCLFFFHFFRNFDFLGC